MNNKTPKEQRIATLEIVVLAIKNELEKLNKDENSLQSDKQLYASMLTENKQLIYNLKNR